MRLDFRQTYGTVGEPGAWRSSIQLAPRAAGFLRKLAGGGKRSGVIAVAVEVLYAIIQGTEPEVEECAETHFFKHVQVIVAQVRIRAQPHPHPGGDQVRDGGDAGGSILSTNLWFTLLITGLPNQI